MAYGIPAPPTSVAFMSVMSTTPLQTRPFLRMLDGSVPPLTTLSKCGGSSPASVLPLFSAGRLTIITLSSNRNSVQWSVPADAGPLEDTGEGGSGAMASCTSMQSTNWREFEMSETGKSSMVMERQCMIAMRFVSASVSAFAMTVAAWIASSKSSESN